MNAIAILKAGMVTPVGLTAAATCAAMRAAISAFDETNFVLDGDWLIGARVPFATGYSGRERLLQMVVPAIRECLAGFPPEAPAKMPLLLCLAEEDRPGRLTGLDHSMIDEIGQRLGARFSAESAVFSQGRVAGVWAMQRAAELLARGFDHCVLAGVDSLFVGLTLNAYYAAGRVKTGKNSNGFIPGEAAAAVLLGPGSSASRLLCRGIGFGREPATIRSEEPLRADGLREALLAAMESSSLTWAHIDYRITDANGEHYWFKEASLAQSRTMRVRKPEVDFWHPADCIGEVGAAIVPCALGVALDADTKAYAPGPVVLCHFSSDGEERGALILHGSMPPNPANQPF